MFGNLGMGIINARLYNITQDDIFRVKAVETAQALTDSKYMSVNGVFINDRDAWANGSFVGDWVNEVLTLKGIRKADRDMIRNTANSIASKCRTEDGYYKAEWLGGNRWTSATARLETPTTPQQILTTSNTIHFLMAAALAEKLGI